MMALSDVLTARADNARATAQVDCVALGEVTLEALPLRELERYQRGADADRAVFYAACRELQRVGAELLRAGKVYRPDQVTELVSGDEARQAAEAVRALSGWIDGQDSSESDLSEVRLDAVQENAEVRHDTVQQDVTENSKIRHSFVQTGGGEVGDGQVSREFLTEKPDEPAKPDTEQVLWSETAQTPQNVVKMDKMDSGLRNIAPFAAGEQTAQKRKKTNRAHESKSEFGERLHENESDFQGGEVREMHETTSEFAETLHESESDFAENVHESTSEFAKILHENKSELAECMARELLEGLRRAAWVR